jgi:DNA-binding NtrC family response regulator
MTANDREPPAPIIGESVALRGAVELARRLANRDATVLLIAPTGCGKELFAQHIHHWSGRPGELVALNCAGLPATLVESELFGHTAGAFTDGRRPKPGLIDIADGRTLLLDEVTSLPLEAQGTLLRVLETGEVRPVGGTTTRRVKVRFIAAAQEDLPERIAQGRFRRDLYERLAQGIVRIPSLAERQEDVVLLARHFAGLDGRVLEADAMAVLLAYDWPGNVRELRNVILQAGWLVEDGTLPARSVEQSMAMRIVAQDAARRAGHPRGSPPQSAKHRLFAVCAAHGWHAGRTARALGVSRTTLYTWLRRQGISLRAVKRHAVVHNCSEQP